jgi:tRNA-binding protein
MDALKAFEVLDVRVGRVVSAENFPQARNPALKMTIDFGPAIGLRSSSAQLTINYAPAELVGKLVLGVVNFPPKVIAGFESQVLVLGLQDETGSVVLAIPDRPVPVGGRLF